MLAKAIRNSGSGCGKNVLKLE